MQTPSGCYSVFTRHTFVRYPTGRPSANLIQSFYARRPERERSSCAADSEHQPGQVAAGGVHQGELRIVHLLCTAACSHYSAAQTVAS